MDRMTGRPAHTPYDGSATPFTIGLKPLDPADWIEVDDHLEAYLAEKDRLYAAIPGKVFMAEDASLEAQREVLGMLRQHLPRRFPHLYRLLDDTVMEIAGGRRISLDDPALPPLRTASLLVQEDLVLMTRDEAGWRLAAASLCFPSSWSLAEKFGKPLDEIHAPVPAFGAGTRNAELIGRMFDRLQGQTVQRLNWSISASPDLYLPLTETERNDRAAARPARFTGDVCASAFIRIERQTLRKLPLSGAILFTIRIHVDPLGVLKSHPDRARLAASFAAQLAALDRDQLDYKGLAADRDRLLAALHALAEIPIDAT